MIFRPLLVKFLTYRLIDSLDDEILDHLLGVEKSASKRHWPYLQCIVGSHHIVLFKCSDKGIDCRDIVIRRASFEKIVADSKARREAFFLCFGGLSWQRETGLDDRFDGTTWRLLVELHGCSLVDATCLICR